MGITSVLNIAASGMTASRVAIEITSENIANVNTPGYSRQTTVFETGPVITATGIPMGSGVRIADIQRNHDQLLQLQLVRGGSAFGESSVKQTALEQIEPLFNELTSDGLGQAVEDFFGSWEDLSLNPQGAAERQAVLARTQTLTDIFNQMNTSLQDARNNADATLVGITADITDKAKNIASLNVQILQTENLGGNANELKDQREYLLRQLSEEVGITSAEQSDGTVTVQLPGGQNLVQGSAYGSLSTQVNAGTNLNDVMFTPIGGGAPVNVTATIGGTNNTLGKIGGTLQVRDSIIPGYLAALDEMANQLVSAVNAQHAAGFGLDGTQNNFFDPAGTTSGTIRLNPALTAAKIAAAGQDPTMVSGPGDNTNAGAMAAIKTQTLGFTVGGTVANATLSSYYSSLVSKVGIDTRNAQNEAAQNESFLSQLDSLRESNSGVSLDEELTNLIKYQRAFEANAKMINTASDMLDTVMGLVR